jgi:hypothetical protein
LIFFRVLSSRVNAGQPFFYQETLCASACKSSMHMRDLLSFVFGPLFYTIPSPTPTLQILWVVTAQTEGFADPMVLFTNRSALSALEAQQVYQDWRYRPMIEHLYRFIQEDGLDIEEIQVQTLERQRCTFVLVLAAALFVLRLPGIWRRETVAFLRALGSSTADTDMHRQGPYEILIGLHRVLSTLSLLSCLASRADKPIGSTSWLPGTWPKSFG